jgi:hypothetical protein
MLSPALAAEPFFETSVDIYKTKECHIAEESSLQIRGDNLMSHELSLLRHELFSYRRGHSSRAV